MGEARCKIVVFGSYNAGKSTFIHSLDPASRHVEVQTEGGTTTVALDFGRVNLGDRQIFLFGTPGQERFEFARQLVSRGMHAALMVVDSTAEMDGATEKQYLWLKGLDIPYAIMLNKCDKPASRKDEFLEYFSGEAVYPISALSSPGVLEAFSAFIGNILPPATIQ